jgi:hypothetical protein
MSPRDPRWPLAAAPRDARQELRVPVSLEGMMGNSQLGRRKVELLDLSCLGCRVGSVLNLAIGSHVVITLPDLAPLGAQVRWVRQGNIGLRFDRALHPMVASRVRALSPGGAPGQDQPANP